MLTSQSIRSAVRRALLAGTALAAVPVFPTQAADETISEVVVTGTRIPRANLTAPTAVTTIDAEVIQQSGMNNVADILRAVPSFGVSALTSANSNFLTAGSGINTLQLRNLEEDRTLVLVNGRRYISGVPGSAAVDFNTVPIELVERVEIITGGASAIYGSDALAGVINVILKRNYEGVNFGYQFGEATEGGAIQNRATFTAGGNFNEGRGNAVVSATYSEDKGLLSRERENTRLDDVANCPANCKESIDGTFSTFSEFGRFAIPSTGEAFTVDNSGALVPYNNGAFGFNRQAFRRYTVPTQRYLVSSLFNYELGADVNSFVEATFAQTRTVSELEPFPHSHSNLSLDGISIDNPFVPQALRDAALAEGDTVIEYRRRLNEIGARGATSTRNTYRFVVGFEGDIQDRWKWKTYYDFGRMDDAQQGGGQINVLNMREALNVVVDPVTSDLVCASASARAEGCVPINLFGQGSITPEAANYVRAPTSRQSLTQQQVFGADFGGALFDLPAGPLSVAVGGEWRRERAEDVPDTLTQAGLNGGNRAPPTFGDFDVREGFMEVDVPLLHDLPLVHDLSIGGAYRYSDYSTVGTTNAYTGRLSWSPIEPLRLRAQYARAVRAPNIGELFAPGGENFAPVADPCDGVTATTAGNIAQNCRSLPEIAQRIAAEGIFELTLAEQQGTGGFTGHGNANLDAETSDSWALGMIFDQGFAGAGNMTLSIDYFSIKIDQLIDTIDRQSAADFCFDSDPATFAANEFCSFLVRDTTGPAFQLGELEEVNSAFINEGTLETEGVDLSLLWQFNLPDLIAAIPGQLAVRLNYTHLLDFTQTKFAAEDDLVGETGFAEDKGQTALVYSIGPWTAQWEWNYIGDSVPDKSNPVFDFSVGSWSTHDLQLAFNFRDSGMMQGSMLEGTRLYVGAHNLFDEEAPLILSGVPGNTTGTDTNASIYDPVGRTWYAGVNVSF
jgi:iron complex outermembrane receptor protein